MVFRKLRVVEGKFSESEYKKIEIIQSKEKRGKNNCIKA